VKLHRVETKLPVGVSLRIERATRGFKSPLDIFDIGQLTESIMQHTSNTPISFTLDVPEEAATETARALRAMAHELETGKRP